MVKLSLEKKKDINVIHIKMIKFAIVVKMLMIILYIAMEKKLNQLKKEDSETVIEKSKFI